MGFRIDKLTVLRCAAITSAIFAAAPQAAHADQLLTPVKLGDNPHATEMIAVSLTQQKFWPLAVPDTNFKSFDSPTWAGDGSSYAYVSVGKSINKTGGNDVADLREIWLVTADGAGGVERRRITRDGFDYLPVFAPDGKRIAFARDYPARSGAGCARGGFAISLVSTRTAAVKRISRCFTESLLRSTIQFVDDGSRVAFVGDRHHVTAVSISGADSALPRPRVIYKQPANETVVSIRSALPRVKSLWIDFEDGGSALANTANGRGTTLPDAAFDVSPNGKTTVGNCSIVPSEGICLTNVKTLAHTKLKTPFNADFTQDSLEFGFSFSSNGRSLVSFGHSADDATLGSIAGQQVCLRKTLDVAPDCQPVPLGTVAERDSDVAAWQPSSKP